MNQYGFEYQGQRSKIKATRDKKRAVHSRHLPAATEWNALAENNVTHQQTGPFRPCWGAISAACGRCMFGKTSLAGSVTV